MIKSICDVCEKNSFDGTMPPHGWFGLKTRYVVRSPTLLCPDCAKEKFGQEFLERKGLIRKPRPCGTEIGRPGCLDDNCPCVGLKKEGVPVHHGGGRFDKVLPAGYDSTEEYDEELALGA